MYKIRFLDPNDGDLVALVFNYVADNADDGIRPRPVWMMQKAVKTGEVLILERDGQIAGTSFVYEFMQKDGDAESYLEIGTMMIPDEQDNGFRGQQIFSLLHIFNTCYANDNLPEIFAVVPKKGASRHIMMKHVGMQVYSQIPEKLLSLRSQKGIPFDEKKMTVYSDKDSIVKNLNILRDLVVRENKILSPKAGVEIIIDAHMVNRENIDREIDRRL